jgi:hypothetical protein
VRKKMSRQIIIFGICMMLLIPAVNIVTANSPPEIPTIEGPSSGSAGTSYTYKFCSSDPDGDEIYYCVDWDDGTGELCYGPFPSETCIEESHAWTSDGTYSVKVKARDSNQAESDWATLTVTMPKIKQNLLQMVLEILLQNFPILRILLLLI